MAKYSAVVFLLGPGAAINGREDTSSSDNDGTPMGWPEGIRKPFFACIDAAERVAKGHR